MKQFHQTEKSEIYLQEKWGTKNIQEIDTKTLEEKP
jgi:hypothetical protein